jgi:hypothetical protein
MADIMAANAASASAIAADIMAVLVINITAVITHGHRIIIHVTTGKTATAAADIISPTIAIIIGHVIISATIIGTIAAIIAAIADVTNADQG